MTITIDSPCGRGPVMGSSSYNTEEADNILRAAPLMTEAELMRRWHCDRRWLRALVNGHHPYGIKLPAVRLSPQKLRFRRIDVAAIEETLWDDN